MPVNKDNIVEHETKFGWTVKAHESLRLFCNAKENEYNLVDKDDDMILLFVVTENTVLIKYQSYQVKPLIKRSGVIEVGYEPEEEENDSFSARGELPPSFTEEVE